MLQRPRTAQDSVLLDYVSRSSISSLIKSMKARHFQVTYAVLGGLLIKLLIAASLGLFDLQLVTITTESNPFSGPTSLDVFDFAAFDPGRVGGLPAIYTLSGLTQPLQVPGINHEIPAAYQIVAPQSGFHEVVVDTTAIVDALLPNITCRPMSPANVSRSFCAAGSASTCQPTTVIEVRGMCRKNFTVSISDSLSGPTGFVISQTIDCDGKSEATASLAIFKGVIDATNSSLLIESAFVECTAKPILQKASIALNSSGKVSTFELQVGSTIMLEALDAGDLIKAVHRSASVAANVISRKRLAELKDESTPWPPSLLNVKASEIDPLVMLAGYASRNANLGNSTQLQNSVTKALNLVAMQIAAKYLKTPSRDTIDGTVSISKQRLMLNEVSVRLMEALVAILILLAAVLIVDAPSKATPRDLSTAGGLATVLTQSPRAVYSLQRTVNMDMAQREFAFRHRKYATTVTDHDPNAFVLLAIMNDNEAPDVFVEGEDNGEPPKSWWSPLPILPRAAISLLPFVFIITIELLHQRSEQNDGLCNASSTGTMPFAVSFVTALILTFGYGIIGFVDFYTKLLSPYHRLKKNPSTAQQTILRNYLSQTSIAAVFQAAFDKHLVVVLTGLATVICPVLVIVAGSLFVNAVGNPQRVNGVRTLMNFNTPSPLAAKQFHLISPAVLKDIESTSSPRAYGGLVFPQIKLPNDIISNVPQAASASTNLAFTATVPGIQAQLNCSKVRSEDVKIFFWPPVVGENTGPVTRRVATPVPAGCETPCRNESTVNTCDGKTRWEGDTLDQIYDNAGSSIAGSYFASTAHMSLNSSQASCPQFSFVWGRNSDDVSAVDKLVAYNCYPFISSQPHSVTFDARSWTVLFASPVPGSSITPLTDSSTPSLNPDLLLPTYKHTKTNISPWLGHLLTSNTIPLSSLASASSADSIISALEETYTLLSASSLSTATHNLSIGQNLTGTLHDPTRHRIRLSTPSVRILEILLAIILLLNISPYFLTSLSSTLPANPCSIAVLGSLIASSEITTRTMVPVGSEWCSNDKLQKEGVFEEARFSLGMFDGMGIGGKGERWFGVGVGQAEIID